MSRIATLASSFGVGSLSVGIRDVNAQDRRAIFQLVNDGTPFQAELYATQDFDFTTGVGSNWERVTDRAKNTSDQDSDFVLVSGTFVKKRDSALGLPISEAGVYAFDDGFMPAAFNIEVTTITSGSPIKILFGV
jgi:hypothetical protein